MERGGIVGAAGQEAGHRVAWVERQRTLQERVALARRLGRDRPVHQRRRQLPRRPPRLACGAHVAALRARQAAHQLGVRVRRKRLGRGGGGHARERARAERVRQGTGVLVPPGQDRLQAGQKQQHQERQLLGRAGLARDPQAGPGPGGLAALAALSPHQRLRTPNLGEQHQPQQREDREQPGHAHPAEARQRQRGAVDPARRPGPPQLARPLAPQTGGLASTVGAQPVGETLERVHRAGRLLGRHPPGDGRQALRPREIARVERAGQRVGREAVRPAQRRVGEEARIVAARGQVGQRRLGRRVVVGRLAGVQERQREARRLEERERRGARHRLVQQLGAPGLLVRVERQPQRRPRIGRVALVGGRRIVEGGGGALEASEHVGSGVEPDRFVVGRGHPQDGAVATGEGDLDLGAIAAGPQLGGGCGQGRALAHDAVLGAPPQQVRAVCDQDVLAHDERGRDRARLRRGTPPPRHVVAAPNDDPTVLERGGDRLVLGRGRLVGRFGRVGRHGFSSGLGRFLNGSVVGGRRGVLRRRDRDRKRQDQQRRQQRGCRRAARGPSRGTGSRDRGARGAAKQGGKHAVTLPHRHRAARPERPEAREKGPRRGTVWLLYSAGCPTVRGPG